MDKFREEHLIKSLTESVKLFQEVFQESQDFFFETEKKQFELDKHNLAELKEIHNKFITIKNYNNYLCDEIDSINEDFRIYQEITKKIINDNNKEIKSLKAKLSSHGIKNSKKSKK